MTYEEIQSRIQYIQQDIDSLESQYGVGVRPSWVGEELGILYYKLKMLQKDLENM